MKRARAYLLSSRTRAECFDCFNDATWSMKMVGQAEGLLASMGDRAKAAQKRQVGQAALKARKQTLLCAARCSGPGIRQALETERRIESAARKAV